MDGGSAGGFMDGWMDSSKVKIVWERLGRMGRDRGGEKDRRVGGINVQTNG